MTLIHDHGALAWVVVAAYAVGTLLAFAAAAPASGRERRFWLGTAIALLLLGINKQLDLQTDLTEVARAAARSEGWYDLRRDAQGLFLLAVGLAAVGCGAWLWAWLRNSVASVRAAVVGLVTLLAFVFIRAASFHHIDQWVTINLLWLRSGWWLELLGIAITGSAAAAYRQRKRPDSG